MRCEEFLRLLDADEGWDRGDAAAHAAACPACGAAARRMGAAASAFRAMREDEPPPFLQTRILAHVRAERERAPWWRSLFGARPAWAGPLVVMALVVVLGGYGLKQSLGPARSSAPPGQAARLEGVAPATAPVAAENEAQAPPAAPSQPDREVAPAKKDKGELPREALSEEKWLAPEFTADLPATSASQIPRAEERSRPGEPPRAQADRVEPLSPPFLGAGAEPAEEGEAASRSAQSRPAVAAAPAPVAPAAPAAPADARDDAMLFQARAKEEAAKAQAAGASAGARSLQDESRVEVVPCVLRGGAGREELLLQLLPSVAPPPGVEWAVTVRGDGGLEVRDATGGLLAETARWLQAGLGERELPPGTYRLTRRP